MDDREDTMRWIRAPLAHGTVTFVVMACSAGGAGIPAGDGDGGGGSDGSASGSPDADDGAASRDGSSDGGDIADSMLRVDGPGGTTGTRADGATCTLDGY